MKGFQQTLEHEINEHKLHNECYINELWELCYRNQSFLSAYLVDNLPNISSKQQCDFIAQCNNQKLQGWFICSVKFGFVFKQYVRANMMWCRIQANHLLYPPLKRFYHFQKVSKTISRGFRLHIFFHNPLQHGFCGVKEQKRFPKSFKAYVSPRPKLLMGIVLAHQKY